MNWAASAVPPRVPPLVTSRPLATKVVAPPGDGCPMEAGAKELATKLICELGAMVLGTLARS